MCDAFKYLSRVPCDEQITYRDPGFVYCTDLLQPLRIQQLTQGIEANECARELGKFLQSSTCDCCVPV